jgi:hypothetical protein
VLWAGSQDGTASTMVDDIANIMVSGSKGTHSTSFTYGTQNPCHGVFPLGPQNITSLFSPGSNSVTVTLQDNSCGVNYSSSPLWIVPEAQHFHIELKAWIPQPRVVNPLAPVTEPFSTYLAKSLPFGTNCFVPQPNLAKGTFVYSEFHGDGHLGFDGEFRADVTVDFNWDGTKIKNFQTDVNQQNFGTTTLFVTYLVPIQGTQQCQLQKTATCCVTAAMTGSHTFKLGIDAGIPFFPSAVTPAIFANVTGSILPDGAMDFTGTTGGFPSKGIQVSLNGQVLDTEIFVDAGCLSNGQVLGLNGARRLAEGLLLHFPMFPLVTTPQDSGLQIDHQSFLC